MSDDDTLTQQIRRIHRGSPIAFVSSGGALLNRESGDQRPFRIGQTLSTSGGSVRTLAWHGDHVRAGGTHANARRVTAFSRATGLQAWEHVVDSDTAPAVAVAEDGETHAITVKGTGSARVVQFHRWDADGSAIGSPVTIHSNVSAPSLVSLRMTSDGTLLQLPGRGGELARRRQPDGTSLGVPLTGMWPSGLTFDFGFSSFAAADITRGNEIVLAGPLVMFGGIAVSNTIAIVNDLVELTARTSNSDGVITARPGHTIAAGDVVTLTWDDGAGSRLSVDVDSVTGDEVTVTSGTGTNLPAVGTVLHVMRLPFFGGGAPTLTGQTHITATAAGVIYAASDLTLYCRSLDLSVSWSLDLSGDLTTITRIAAMETGGVYVFGFDNTQAPTTLVGLPLQTRLARVDETGTLLWVREIVTTLASGYGTSLQQQMLALDPGDPSSDTIAVGGVSWPADQFDGVA